MLGDEGVAIHEKVVPLTFETRFTLEEVPPEHITWLMLALVTRGSGLTVITWVWLAPMQLLLLGTIV